MFAAIDEKIRANLLQEAERDLRAWLQSPLERKDRAAVASLCRRLRLPELGLRVLGPIVRPAHPIKPPASAEEKGEYAALLYRAGATSEAEAMLRAVPASEYPKAPLFLAFTLISRWAYQEASEQLQNFLRHETSGSYESLVASVNLAACYLFCDRHDEGDALLQELLKKTAGQNARLLQMNLLELCAQNEIGRGHYAKARDYLDQAEALKPTQPSLDSFFIEKWRGIVDLIEKKETAPTVYRALRTKALSLGHWESIRQLDWYWALHTKNERLMQRVYHGTRYHDFRVRMLTEIQKHWGIHWIAPERFELGWPKAGQENAWIELATGRTSVPGHSLKPNQVPHRLLVTLASDFYKPFRLSAIYGQIFPGEFFSPQSSPGRVHQATHRLKLFFEAAKIPLTIDERDGFFYLSPTSAGGVVLRGGPALGKVIAAQTTELLQKIPAAFKQKPFSAGELAAKLSLPKRTVGRYLGDAVKGELLIKQGQGMNTQYLFPSSQKT